MMMLEPFKVEDKLPPDNTYVLVHLNITNWRDSDDKLGNRYWTVAKFVKGLSTEDRYNPSIPEDRRRVHRSEDEGMNNERPYSWQEFGPSDHFGQDVDVWCFLPEINSSEQS
jgi:hypothetical protein